MVFTCDFCQKSISNRSNLTKHMQICKLKNVVELQHTLQTVEEQIQSLKEQHRLEIQSLKEQHRLEIQSLKEQHRLEIHNLREWYGDKIQGQRQHIERLENQIFEIAKQPKQNIQQNNQKTLIIQQLAPMTLTRERIETELEHRDSEEMFRRGPIAFKEFIIELLHDSETGKPMIMCTDSARRVFIYVDENGELQKDIGMERVHTILSGPLQNFAIREYIRLKELYPKQADGLYDILQRIENYVRDINQFADCSFKNMFEKNKVMIQ